MLTRIDVAGFKAIKSSGALSLGPFTVLIGRNGVGKSSLVEAVQWLQECMVSGIAQATSARFHLFGELVNRRTDEIELRLWFDADSREVRYRLRVVRGVVKSETCYEGRTISSKQTITSRKGNRGPAVRRLANGDVVRSGDEIALSKASGSRFLPGAERLQKWLRDAVFLRLSPTRLAQPARLERTPREPILLEDGANLPALLEELDAGQRRELVDLVKDSIAGARGVSVRREGQMGTFAISEQMTSRGGSKRYDIPSWLLSEGTRRLTAIFALLVRRPMPSLLVIEEIENGLDPWTLAAMFRHLRAASTEGTQVMLTTHSPYLLDHVEPEEVLVVERVDGDTRFRRASDIDLVKTNAGASPTGAMYLARYLFDSSHGRRSL